MRRQISNSETEIKRLQEITDQKAADKQTREEAIRLLKTLSETNLKNATFDEKRDLIAKLGIKVYPSADGKELRISSSLKIDKAIDL